MFCPHCGAQLPDGSAFCGNCGSPLSAAPQVNPNPMPEQPPVPPAQPPVQPPAGQPGGAYYQGTAPQQGPVMPAVQPAKRPFHVTRGMTIGILAVGVVAVVAIVLAVTGVFGGGGHGSAQSIADSVESAFTDLIASDLEGDDWERFGLDIVSLMPEEAVEVSMDKQGFESREDFAEYFGEAVGSLLSYAMAYLDMETAYFDMVDLSFEIEIGSQLDSDDVDSMNERFDDFGVDLEIEEAYELRGNVTATPLEDFGGYEEGESESSDMGYIGLCAVKIGGSWYLWVY